MAKKKASNFEISSGWAIALSSIIFSLLFMLSVTHRVMDKIAVDIDTSPNMIALIGALLTAVLSWKFEPKARVLLPFVGGILLASYFIWHFGLH